MSRRAFSQWDVVKVPFPFTEGIGDKRRPALIVSAPGLSAEHKLYWLLMVTSVVDPLWNGDVPIDDLERAGLPVASIVRTAKIATLQEDRILGRIGTLGSAERKKVSAALDKWL